MQKITRQFIFVLLTIFTLLIPHSLTAQVLRGHWVNQSDAAIKQYRMRDLRVIVLDENSKPIENANVHVTQLKHAFTWGAVLPKNTEVLAEWFDGSAPVWRVFNAVSLDRYTQWNNLQPQQDSEIQNNYIGPILHLARQGGKRIHWGRLINADEGQNPEWLTGLQGNDLAQSLDQYSTQILLDYKQQVSGFSIYSGMLDRDFMTEQLGLAMLRKLVLQTKAVAPHANLAIAFSDTLLGKRRREMFDKIISLRESMIPVTRIAVSQEVTGVLVPSAIERDLAWFDRLDANTIISNLSISGDSEAGAALNMEIMLRLLFAQEKITAIYFAGLYPNESPAPNSSLFKIDGSLSSSGQTLEQMIRKLWWTNESAATDDLGNAFFSVYAGSHQITINLPDGEVVRTTVYAEVGQDPQIVLIEPLKQ
ncbi:hypothetical protein KS4_24320 [Poriferisphaera corsica]|uniref:endo-1,4-beta-xylanase n=1 Tax=Poriferisphaera corsica TaxID=2528020 RepID=A0A517YVV9_9BACT|nr:hypothetical protein [Poriferisphaera corsica]QDU34364.1 hypothetical protein KS4_24320 [Poriferisphaera corsica]